MIHKFEIFKSEACFAGWFFEHVVSSQNANSFVVGDCKNWTLLGHSSEREK